MAELAYASDLKSEDHNGRVGSSPIGATIQLGGSIMPSFFRLSPTNKSVENTERCISITEFDNRILFMHEGTIIASVELQSMYDKDNTDVESPGFWLVFKPNQKNPCNEKNTAERFFL